MHEGMERMVSICARVLRYLRHGSSVVWKDSGRDEARAWFQGDIRVKDAGMDDLDLVG